MIWRPSPLQRLNRASMKDLLLPDAAARIPSFELQASLDDQ